MKHKITLPITINIPEGARPFGDDLIHARMREAVTVPPASKLLGVKILGKSKADASADFVIKGELTFGRWFPFPGDAS